MTIAIALAGGLGWSIALAATSGTAPIHAALIDGLALSYTLSGLIAWWRRPTNRIGPLMIITGFCALATTLSWADGEVSRTVGQAVDVAPLVLFVHVFLAFPTGRLHGRWERALVGAGYLAAIGMQLTVMALGGLGSGNVLQLVDQRAAAETLHSVELVIISAVALAAAARLVLRRRAGGRPLRRSLALLIDAFALGLVTIAILLLVGVFAELALPAVQQISLALFGLAPVTFLAGLLQARLARDAVGDLVQELRREPKDLRAPLARALRDPSLSLVYWLPQFDGWADQDGAAVDLPDDSKRVTPIEQDGVRIAALIHDPALNDEPELLDAVTAAAAIALRTGWLQAELRANLVELRGSRARVIEAGQRERKRLERDLHDGAQQRLVALSLDLGILQTSLTHDASTAALLSQARHEIATSLEELRDLARGLHPAVLSAHGLGVALESLVAKAPVPVQLTIAVEGRTSESVEVAAYYVASPTRAMTAARPPPTRPRRRSGRPPTPEPARAR